MKCMDIVLFGCYLIGFERLFVLGQNYDLRIFRDITEVPENGDPTSNTITDDFVRERGLAICRDGFVLVKSHQRGQHFKFLQNVEVETVVETIKYYVLVDAFTVSRAEDSNDEIIVFSAYRCPTSPPTYIHIDLNLEEENQGPIISIIFKDSGPLPSFKEIIGCQLKLVEEITEANVQEIISTSASDVENSLYDTDEFSIEQRLQMCTRLMQTVPDKQIQFSKNSVPGTSKYYNVITRIDEGDEDTETLIDVRVVRQAFQCPTKPELYVQINDDGPKEGPILSGTIKSSEIEKRLPFDITGYGIVRVESIEVWKVSSETRRNEKLEQEDDDKDDVKEVIRQFGTIIMSNVDGVQQRLNRRDAVTGTNKLTNEERLDLCGKSIKAISGQDAEFSVGTPGSSLYYTVEPEGVWEDGPDVVEAFECPTKPKVHLHISDCESEENMILVFVRGVDFDEFLTRFENSSPQSHI